MISLYEIGQKVRLGKQHAMAPLAPELVERAYDDGPFPQKAGRSEITARSQTVVPLAIDPIDA